MIRKMWFAGAIALAAGLFAPATSQAAFAIRFLSGTGTELLRVTDNGAGDNAPLANVISFSGLVGGFQISVAGGTTDAPGTGTFASLTSSIDSVVNRMTSTNTIIFEVSANDYNLPSSPSTAFSTGTASFNSASTAGNTVTLASFFNDGNALFSREVAVGGASTVTKTVGPPVPQSGVFATGQQGVNYTGTYSLTQRFTFTVAGNPTEADASVGVTGRLDVFAAAVPAVPAPATIVMLLAATPVLGLARRLRRGNVGAPLVV